MSYDLPEHWQVMPLEDAIDALIDYRGKTPKKTESGIPLITAKIVKDGRIQEPSEFIDEGDYDSWMIRGLPEVGDIVVTTEAPLGEIAQLESSNVALAQRIVALRGKTGLLNNDFLLYAMQSSFVQRQLKSRASGSTVKGIKQSELRKVLLPIPPEDEQIEIAKHLKSIDQKISLNRQINQTLEALTQAIFKSWFVDFEPVKAKIAAIKAGEDAEGVTCAVMRAISGKSNEELDKMQAEQPEHYAHLKTIAELFPSAMKDSELGEVPVGWEVVDLKELSKTISKGTTPSNKQVADAEGVPSISFVKVKDIADDGQINRAGLELIHESIHKGALKRSMLEENDLLFSIAGTIGRVSIVENDLHNSNTNQAIAFIRLNKEEHLFLVLEHLKSKRIQESAIASVVQGVQANVSLTSVGSFQIIVPKEPILAAWNEVAISLHTEKLGRQRQNRLLSKLRDTLLPKLLSGELEVNTVNKAES